MKTIVSVNEINELEIKPQAELLQWKQISKEEIESRWKSSAELHEVHCPVCNGDQYDPAFDKIGFSYVECTNCQAIFSKTRPSSSELHWWYTQSKSAQFWQEKLLKLSANSRRIKIVEPRAQWILDGISEYIQSTPDEQIKLTDISFFGRALVETISDFSENIQIISSGILADKEGPLSEKIVINPLTSIDNPGTLEATDVLVAIDVLDRVQNIKGFFSELEKVIKPGGIFFATCPVASGFEIQSLWDKSPSIIPPDKLNLPSISGLIDLFSRSDQWEILELSTPGMFDVECVIQEMKNNIDFNWPRSLHVLLGDIDKQGIVLFTEYLQSQRLSSFARIVLRKKNHKIY